MNSYIGGIIVILVALAMIFYGRAQDGVPRPFLRSYPILIAYAVTTITLLVFGVAWIVAGAG
jgi:hypothetical protein